MSLNKASAEPLSEAQVRDLDLKLAVLDQLCQHTKALHFETFFQKNPTEEIDRILERIRQFLIENNLGCSAQSNFGHLITRILSYKANKKWFEEQFPEQIERLRQTYQHLKQIRNEPSASDELNQMLKAEMLERIQHDYWQLAAICNENTHYVKLLEDTLESTIELVHKNSDQMQEEPQAQDQTSNSTNQTNSDDIESKVEEANDTYSHSTSAYEPESSFDLNDPMNEESSSSGDSSDESDIEVDPNQHLRVGKDPFKCVHCDYRTGSPRIMAMHEHGHRRKISHLDLTHHTAG